VGTLLPESPAINAGKQESGIPDFDIGWDERVEMGVNVGPYEK